MLRAGERFDSRSFSEGWYPGARTITNLSWVQELTKTVTSLLNIPSVLAQVLMLKLSLIIESNGFTREERKSLGRIC